MLLKIICFLHCYNLLFSQIFNYWMSYSINRTVFTTSRFNKSLKTLLQTHEGTLYILNYAFPIRIPIYKATLLSTLNYYNFYRELKSRIHFILNVSLSWVEGNIRRSRKLRKILNTLWQIKMIQSNNNIWKSVSKWGWLIVKSKTKKMKLEFCGSFCCLR